MAVDLDPHLLQLQLEEAELHPDPATPRRVGVIARVSGPEVQIPGLEVVVRAGTVVTGRMDLDAVGEVRRHPDVLSLKRTHNYLPAEYLPAAAVPASQRRTDAAPRDRTAAPPLPWTGRGVVVGLLDWGFDVAHADLVTAEARTRFLALWDQRGGRTPLSPQPYGYGREFDAATIDRALASADPYAALRYDPAEVDPLGHGTHGTHALAIACGGGRAPGSTPGLARDAAIVAVHLRGDDTSPHDTLGDSVRILEGVDYVFRRAGDRPVVLNLSLGRCGGPHDRSPLLVRAIDAMLETPGRQVVCSAGNYFSSAQHASAQLTPDTPVEWEWLVEPPLVDNAELELWYAAGDDLTVELIAPGDAFVVDLPRGEQRVVRDAGRVVVSAFHRHGDPGSGDNVADLFLWPSAPPGTWRVRIVPRYVENGEVHGWIERAYRGRQSRFADPDPLFTTNTICNGRRTLAVAAYDHRAPVPSPGPFSSAGPARDLHPKPDLTAPGVAITAARSSSPLNGRRERDGLTTMTGTSMAAPHVTGAVAVLYEAAGRSLTAQEVGDLLRTTARPVPPAGPERVGPGALDVGAALRRLTTTPAPPAAHEVNDHG